ncbi:spore germination protein [Desmospora profundinema]|uniref:Spore germination protein n=1 Tax=Desmospora profundinema TaxID=1571184 RepID=A0ABU1IK02_9BACL|nr:spore germination protein [Desmospora profundinema]MDR6225021.1 hypothetical protein [Desmospora profundinema]
MPVANQIFNAKFMVVDTTGAVNMGNAVNVGRFYNAKSLGGSGPVGDFSANVQGGFNFAFDPDIIDQV